MSKAAEYARTCTPEESLCAFVAGYIAEKNGNADEIIEMSKCYGTTGYVYCIAGRAAHAEGMLEDMCRELFKTQWEETMAITESLVGQNLVPAMIDGMMRFDNADGTGWK